MAAGQYLQLRVFVSSTFQDMLAERAMLVGEVFPQVAAHCHERNVEFIGVDLLWGVTDEQSARGETVDICLSEIDRCRPLFVGFVGERYGWVPDGSDTSVTEQEMRYGALEAPQDTEAFFYLRAPSLTESLCGPFESDERQERLRRTILESRFPVLDGYTELDDLTRHVVTDLEGAVDRILATRPELSPVEEARAGQIFHAQRHTANYVDRPEAFEQLDESINAGGLLLLTGAAGVGKTTLASKWVLDHIHDEDRYVFVYYLGEASGQGWEQLAGQLVGELSARFSLDYPSPTTNEDLRRAVHIVLSMAAKSSRIVLVIDQLDALPLDDAFGMSWLPESLPEGVSVVASAEEGDAADRLRLREHHELVLAELSSQDVPRVAREYLAFYSKALGDAHLAMLEASPPARNPRYLTTLLDEIRHTGRHDELAQQLGTYLSCRGTRQLCHLVLDRIEREFDREGDQLPRRLLSLLVSSRVGLTEGELVSLLGDVPQYRLAPLRIALEPFTSIINGSTYLATEEFREAAIEHFAIDCEAVSACRSQIIDWFAAHRSTPRYSYVLPWLLAETGDYEGLLAVLADIACFAQIWDRSRFELKSYWSTLEQAGINAAKGYAKILENPQECDASTLLALAEFLAGMGEAAAAERLLVYLVSLESHADTAVRGMACGLLGNLYHRQGRLALAERLYREKHACAEVVADRYEQQRALGNIGLVALMREDLDGAREAFEGVLSLAISLNQRDAQQVALGNLGNIAFAQDRLPEAQKLYERQRDICTDSGNIAGLINAHGALGVLYGRMGDAKAAEREFLQQLEKSKRIAATDGMANALGNIAALRSGRGERDSARQLLLEKLSICRKAGLFAGEQNSLGNLATLSVVEGDLESARTYASQRAELTRENRAFRQYVEALYQLSHIEQLLSLDEKSRMHRMQADTIARQHGLPRMTDNRTATS